MGNTDQHTDHTTPDVDDELGHLRSELEQLRAEVASLRSARAETSAPATTSTRRQLIRLAGASAVGVVAGTVAGQPGTVAAGDPNDVVKNISNPVTDTTTLDGSFSGPVFSLVNTGGTSTASSLYARSSASGNPTLRADNDDTSGTGGVAVGANAPGGRDIHALGSGRIAMVDHDYGTAEAYDTGEIHQSGGALYAMVTPTIRREIVGPASAGALHPVEPTRVYDSRLGQPLFGPLGSGQTRLVSVADGRDLGSGAVNAPGLVPAGATMVVFNLTATQTIGQGWLSIAPSTSDATQASLINWSADGTTVANSSIVQLGPDSVVRVRCGGIASSAHFIIDVVGYHA